MKTAAIVSRVQLSTVFLHGPAKLASALRLDGSHRVAESQMCCFIIYCSNGDGRCKDNMICFFFLVVNTWYPVNVYSLVRAKLHLKHDKKTSFHIPPTPVLARALITIHLSSGLSVPQ
jgi:hypothetical protein